VINKHISGIDLAMEKPAQENSGKMKRKKQESQIAKYH